MRNGRNGTIYSAPGGPREIVNIAKSELFGFLNLINQFFNCISCSSDIFQVLPIPRKLF